VLGPADKRQPTFPTLKDMIQHYHNSTAGYLPVPLDVDHQNKTCDYRPVVGRAPTGQKAVARLSYVDERYLSLATVSDKDWAPDY